MRVVVGLGSNLGDRAANLRDALARLTDHAGVVLLGASSVLESAPLGPPQGPYLNAAALLESAVPLRALLDLALSVEQAMGRVRRVRWGPRVIDIDLLWADAEPMHEPGLTVPHPELLRRDFALAPLLEVLPEAPASYREALAALARTVRPTGLTLAR